MNRVVWMLAVLTAGLVQAVEIDCSKLDWKLTGCVVREGDEMVFDLRTDTEAKKGGMAEATVDLMPLNGRRMVAEIALKGEGLADPQKADGQYQFALYFNDPEQGRIWMDRTYLKDHAMPSDWEMTRILNGFAHMPCSSKATLRLFFRGQKGRVSFDLATLRIREDLVSCPMPTKDYRIKYPRRVLDDKPRRGVMSPARDLTPDDIATMEKWGVNLIRLQFNRTPDYPGSLEESLLAYDKKIDDYLNKLDWVLKEASKRDWKVVVALFGMPGGRLPSHDFRLTGDKRCFDHFVETWRKIARRVKGHPAVYGYDLMNEPFVRAVPTYIDYWNAQRICAEEIRKIDPDTTIIVEGPHLRSTDGFAYLTPLKMDNVIYQVHVYWPQEYTHQGVGANPLYPEVAWPDKKRDWDAAHLRHMLRFVRDFERRYGAKIYVGEFSAIGWAQAPEKYLEDVIQMIEDSGWDWSYHAFREWEAWDVECESAFPIAEKRRKMKPALEETPRAKVLKRGLRGEIRGRAPRVSSLFGDGMVLQRDQPTVVWGEAVPNARIEVSFEQDTVCTNAAESGLWEVTLPPRGVRKTGSDLVIRARNFERRIRDVLVGDVWVCSGQSNMEMPFAWGVLGGDAAKADSTNFPGIRAVKVSHKCAPLPQREVCLDRGWTRCVGNALDGVTACGWYFARELNRETGIPIGIVDCNWSGCAIEPFVSAEGFQSVPSLRRTGDELMRVQGIQSGDKGRKDIAKAVDVFLAWAEEAKKVRARGEEVVYFPNWGWPVSVAKAGQYNAMVAPLVRFPVTGVIWYQGCTNSGDGDSYVDKTLALVNGWRKAWNRDLPFYVVQLSSWTARTDDPAGGNGFARLRDAQFEAFRKMDNTGLVVTTDIGNDADIHPKNKQDVGMRLSRWALHDVYGRSDLVVSGPLYRSMRREGKGIRIFFDFSDGLFAGEKGPNTPGELPVRAKDGKLKGFAVSDADGKWAWADAVIDGRTILVSSATVEHPVNVRYAYRANPMGNANLYNSAGLPAAPFATENHAEK